MKSMFRMAAVVMTILLAMCAGAAGKPMQFLSSISR